MKDVGGRRWFAELHGRNGRLALSLHHAGGPSGSGASPVGRKGTWQGQKPKGRFVV